MLTDKEINHFSTELPEGVKIVDIRREKNESGFFDIWSFIERYYPNYSSCDEITYNNDLYIIVENERMTAGNNATKVYKELHKNLDKHREINPNLPLPTHDQIIAFATLELTASNARIYQKAIEGFIEFMKGGQDV